MRSYEEVILNPTRFSLYSLVMYAVCDKPKDAQFVCCESPQWCCQSACRRVVRIRSHARQYTKSEVNTGLSPQIICAGACTQEVEPQVLPGGQGH